MMLPNMKYSYNKLSAVQQARVNAKIAHAIAMELSCGRGAGDNEAQIDILTNEVKYWDDVARWADER